MNKLRRFFGRISAEICLKIDYFGSKVVVVVVIFIPGSTKNKLSRTK